MRWHCSIQASTIYVLRYQLLFAGRRFWQMSYLFGASHFVILTLHFNSSSLEGHAPGNKERGRYSCIPISGYICSNKNNLFRPCFLNTMNTLCKKLWYLWVELFLKNYICSTIIGGFNPEEYPRQIARASAFFWKIQGNASSQRPFKGGKLLIEEILNHLKCIKPCK